RRMAIAVAGVLLAAIVTTTAFAARATKDPKTLALQLSDLPAGTRAGPAYGIRGPLSSTYTASFEIRPGDLKREEDVEIQVWVAKDAAGAKGIYQQTLATYTGKGPQIGAFAKAFKGEAVLRLPAY